MLAVEEKSREGTAYCFIHDAMIQSRFFFFFFFPLRPGLEDASDRCVVPTLRGHDPAAFLGPSVALARDCGRSSLLLLPQLSPDPQWLHVSGMCCCEACPGNPSAAYLPYACPGLPMFEGLRTPRYLA